MNDVLLDPDLMLPTKSSSWVIFIVTVLCFCDLVQKLLACTIIAASRIPTIDWIWIGIVSTIAS